MVMEYTHSYTFEGGSDEDEKCDVGFCWVGVHAVGDGVREAQGPGGGFVQGVCGDEHVGCVVTGGNCGD